jgi:hypothetical protein
MCELLLVDVYFEENNNYQYKAKRPLNSVFKNSLPQKDWSIQLETYLKNKGLL